MSRLIDADAFEKFIREKYEDGESTDDIKDQMLFDLSYQPTAYDVEKVVAELETLRIDECNYLGVLNITAEKYDRANEMLNDAIEIVRKGGAE